MTAVTIILIIMLIIISSLIIKVQLNVKNGVYLTPDIITNPDEIETIYDDELH